MPDSSSETPERARGARSGQRNVSSEPSKQALRAGEAREGQDPRPADTAGSDSLQETIRHALATALSKSGRTLNGGPDESFAERATREISVQIEQTISGSYQGPIPPPGMLREFDTVVPGLAREIADMAKEEQRHRHRWENRALWNDVFVESGGLSLGWALAGACTLGAFILAIKGNDAGAGILMSPSLAAMVRTIIRGNGSKANKEQDAESSASNNNQQQQQRKAPASQKALRGKRKR